MERVLVRCVCTSLLMFALVAHARDPVPHAPPDLQQMTQRAGFIFLGRVEKVEWKHAPAGGAADRVRISFYVLDGIRGARTGETVAIEEWSGLWTVGNERYVPGETLFVFFYPRSKLGLTSPVAGDGGRIELTPTQRVLLSPEQSAALLPRSLRLQKHQAAAEEFRTRRSTVYKQFAAIVRELAQAPPGQVSPDQLPPQPVLLDPVSP